MTIVIPYRNNPIDLGILLMQLQSQTVKPRVIYLADNSEDGSGLKIARRYQWGAPITVQMQTGGIHRSWNKGIEYAQDDVAILNDDVLIPENFVGIFDHLLKESDAMMYCPANPGFPPTSEVRKDYQWQSQGQVSTYTLDHQQYVLPPSITGWCMVLPQRTIQTIGKFDENFKLYFGDKDYEARIFNSGGKVEFVDHLFVHHYGSSSTFKLSKGEVNELYKQDEKLYKKKYAIT